MELIRTPDECFENLYQYDFAPNYQEITDANGNTIRIHYLDEGPKDGETILCMHGQPSWSYLYRKMIPTLTAAGYRVLAPDLVGFGRSDKPTKREDHSYQNHVDWMCAWLDAIGEKNITLMCQDWGGLIGLRVVGAWPDRFKRLVIANTNLPNSSIITDDVAAMIGQMLPHIPVADAETVRDRMDSGARDAMMYWRKHAAEYEGFRVADVFGIISHTKDQNALAGYQAPFPDERYMAAPRIMPSLVPLTPESKPDRVAGDKAWEVLAAQTFPVLTAFSDGDPLFQGFDNEFQKRLKNVKDVTIKGGGHFLQEDTPEPLCEEIIKFIRETS